jgi:AcrR family transcriptional regulator
MTRMASGRDTHLTPEEIAARALRDYDEGRTPSIRGLASELGVAPTAIYYHFPSRAAIVDAAVGLVWQEALMEGLELIPDPSAADPLDFLVAAAIATRRAFARHYRIAAQLAASQQSNEMLADNLTLVATAFEQLGLDEDEVGAAFHAYGSYTIGSILFLAALRVARDDAEGGAAVSAQAPAVGEGTAEESSFDRTRREIDAMLGILFADPERDEELFARGLRRLITSYLP